MGVIAPFMALAYIVLFIVLVVWLVKSINRIVLAQEQSARSMDRLVESIERLTRERLGGPGQGAA
jgi:uncharacterized protein YoxC